MQFPDANGRDEPATLTGKFITQVEMEGKGKMAGIWGEALEPGSGEGGVFYSEIRSGKTTKIRRLSAKLVCLLEPRPICNLTGSQWLVEHAVHQS